MYRDYRRTAEQRLDRLVKVAVAFTVGCAVGLVASVVTLVWHFAEKFW